MSANAAASRPRSVETALTAYDIAVAAMRRMPSAARTTSIPRGFATFSRSARSAAAVARGAGLCARAPRAHLERSALVDRGDAAATRADFEDVHHRDLDGQ